MATQAELIANLKRRLPDLLPTLDVDVEQPARKGPWDVVLKLTVAGKTRRIVCEVKSVGEPRCLVQAITALKTAAQRDPRVYPLVIAPYISPEGQRLCREAGIGFLDLTGNAFMSFNGTFVDRSSPKPPPRPKPGSGGCSRPDRPGSSESFSSSRTQSGACPDLPRRRA